MRYTRRQSVRVANKRFSIQAFFFYFSFIRLFVVICYYYFGFDFPSSPYISNSNHTKTSCWELTIIAIWLSFFMLGLSNCHVLWFYVSKWNRSQNKYLERFVFVGIGSRLFMPIWSDVMSAHVNSWQLFWIWIKWREEKKSEISRIISHKSLWISVQAS